MNIHLQRGKGFSKKTFIQIIVVASLLFFGIFIRAYHFGDIPIGVHQDEAMAAVDAKALAEYGTDRFGMRYPVHFTAWTYGQMSVLLSYCMVPFIKLLGFSTFSIRLPSLILSSMGLLLLFYIGREFGGFLTGVVVMSMGIICPWHYMQSRWSIDCNLFPHVFLLAVCLLLAGQKKKWLIYLSMVFFGLCCYCYGVANYSVPLFLIAMSCFMFFKKQVTIKNIIGCIVIFLFVSLPEYLTMFINLVGVKTIETPLFTIPYFPDSVRSDDILFTNFSWEQLKSNITWFIKTVWLNGDLTPTSTIAKFGPIYFITALFFVIGLIVLISGIVKNGILGQSNVSFAILLWLLMSVWVGLITKNVMIHRINIIFYPILITSGIGITWLINKCKWLFIPIFATYSILAMMFIYTYFKEWDDISRIYYCENYLNALEYIETIDCDAYYIEPKAQLDVEEQFATTMCEIFTMYAHQIDALYFQGVTNEQNGVTLLPYKERYNYVEVTPEIIAQNENRKVAYLVTYDKLQYFDQDDYNCTDFYGYYYAIWKE